MKRNSKVRIRTLLLSIVMLCIFAAGACSSSGKTDEKTSEITMTDAVTDTDTQAAEEISVSDIPSADISETDIAAEEISVSDIPETEVSETDIEEEPPVFQIESEKTIYCKDERNIKTLYGKAVSYKSSDRNIASVDSNGRLYTNKAGECTITAKDANGNVSKCKVTVIKVCYLTIDDWPNENTDSILKTLDEYDIQATFFVCAGKESIPYYQRIVDEGHVLANHTSSHKSSKIYASKENFYNSVIGLKNYVIKNSDIESVPKILRFPGGSNGYNYEHNGTEITKYMVKKGYHVFDWTAEFRDTRSGANAETCFAAAKKQCKDDREILLLHNKSHSAEALPKVIEYLLSEGYTFAPITMNTKPYNFKKVY